jgi:putative membrane protein
MSRIRTIAVGTLLGAGAAILMTSAAFAQDGRGFGVGFGGRHRGGGFFMIVPMFLLIGVAALVIVLWRGRHVASPVATPPASPTFNAQAILADRLARGEITPDDYRAAVTVLRENLPPPPVG